jgi:hypothetical protein
MTASLNRDQSIPIRLCSRKDDYYEKVQTGVFVITSRPGVVNPSSCPI